MIYVLATNLVDATAFAGKELEIKLRVQSSEARALCTPNVVPKRFSFSDIVYSTPAFEEALTSGKRDAVAMATLVRQRGAATIVKAYDIPETLDRENIEAWLDDA